MHSDRLRFLGVESSWAVVRFVKSIVCVSCKKSDEAKDKIDDGKKV